MAAPLVPLLVGISSGLGVVQAVFGGMQASSQARAQADAAAYNAQVQRNNAALAMQQQQMREHLAAQEQRVASQQAAQEEDVLRREKRRLAGSQMAAAAANNISLTGSFLDVQEDALRQAEKEALNVAYKDELRQWQLKTNTQTQRFDTAIRVANLESGARLYDMEASNARSRASSSVFNTVISGVGAAVGGAARTYGAVEARKSNNTQTLFSLIS